MITEVIFWEAIRKYQNLCTPIDNKIIEWAKNIPDKILQLSLTLNTRFLECESKIIESIDNYNDRYFYSLVAYCNHVLHGRWPELEDFLLNSNSELNATRIVTYSSQVVKGRWKEAEKNIVDPKNIVEYARHAIRDRWHEKENTVLKDPMSVYNYCFYVVGRKKGERWKKGEKVLIEEDFKDKNRCLCDYALYIVRGRWPEAEKYMKNSPHSALAYAHRVINGRWKEGEEAISKDPACSLSYAENVLKGSFPLAEKSLLSSNYYFDYFTFATFSTRELVEKLANQFDRNLTVAEILEKVNDGRNKDFENKLLTSTHNQKKAVWYAANVLKGRWKEAEDIIKRSAKWSVAYARDVIKDRWEDAEKTIIKEPKYLADYGVEVIKDQLPIVLHNILISEKLKGNNHSKINRYFEMLESGNVKP